MKNAGHVLFTLYYYYLLGGTTTRCQAAWEMPPVV